VGRAVVDDDGLEVGERLPPDRFERGADIAAVVVRRDDDADTWAHAAARPPGAVWGVRTWQMQKRYLPDGSCGMRSTNSQRCSVPGPNRSVTSAAILRSLAAVKSAARTMRKTNRRSSSWTI